MLVCVVVNDRYRFENRIFDVLFFLLCLMDVFFFCLVMIHGIFYVYHFVVVFLPHITPVFGPGKARPHVALVFRNIHAQGSS